MEDTKRIYKGCSITREYITESRVNWATHIDGARQNHRTLRDAKHHILWQRLTSPFLFEV